MVSISSIKAQFNKMKFWQKIVVVVVGLYIVKYLLDALKLTATLGTLLAIKNYGNGQTETFDGANSTLTCTMYYTAWCGYCKKAKPHWEKLTDLLNGQNVNGKKILITKIDCDEQPDVAKQQGIQGYPTFKFDIDGKYLDYNGGHTLDDFKQFITSIANAGSA